MKSVNLKWLLAVAVLLTLSGAVRADVKTRLVTEVAEDIMARFGSKAGKSLPALVQKIERYTTLYGEDALRAIRRVGPDAFEILDEAGGNVPKVLRVMNKYGEEGVTNVLRRPKAMAQLARYGEDTAAVLVKHPTVAEPLVERGGPSAIKALEAVSTRNGRRMAMLMDGELGQLPRSAEWLEVIGKFGDRGANFIWENKGSLAIATAMAAFLANPEVFINGTKDLVTVAGETTAKPIAEGVAKGTNWTPVVLIVVVAVISFAVALAAKWGLFTRAVADKVGATPCVPTASPAQDATANKGN